MKILSENGLTLLDGIPAAIDLKKAAGKLRIPAEGPDFRALGDMTAGAMAAGSSRCTGNVFPRTGQKTRS